MVRGYTPICLCSPFCAITILGVVIVLFFRCMGALSNPGNRMKEGVKWGLVTYTAAMFSFVTIFTATNLCIQSLSYIGNQEFPCGNNADCPLPPGNLGKAISVCRILMFFLNSWLADGLLVSSVFDLDTQAS